MKNKYYTPELEEFHNGFEYEFHGMTTGGLSMITNGELIKLSEPSIEIWSKEVFGIYTGEEDFYNFTDDLGQKWSVEIDRELQLRSLKDIRNLIVSGQIRVKYLDQEDIKDLGFTLDKTDGLILAVKKKGLWARLWYDTEDKSLGIEDEKSMIFYGKIKNKSELKKLLKQLGIYEK